MKAVTLQAVSSLCLALPRLSRVDLRSAAKSHHLQQLPEGV